MFSSKRITALEAKIEQLEATIAALTFAKADHIHGLEDHEHPQYTNEDTSPLTTRIASLEKKSKELLPHSHPDRELPPVLSPESKGLEQEFIITEGGQKVPVRQFPRPLR